MNSTSSIRLRRSPQQARSRRRIEHVLETADRLLARQGVDALSTTRVAEAAGISVGSLYQWFPDKAAISEALALRYLDDFKRVMAELADRAERTPPADPVGEALAAITGAFRAQPGFRAMWFGGLRTEELREVTRPGLDEIGYSLGRVLAASAPEAAPADVSTVSRTAVVVADALLRQAFRADNDGDEAILSEARTLLQAYVEARL